MTYIQEYSVAASLPSITDHNYLPCDATEIGRLMDTTEREKLYVLIKRNQYLSILAVFRNLKTNKYCCTQYDFPLKVLSWFPKALEEFQKAPAEGGLHAGAMSSVDEDVDGEMLCVQAATQGYYIVNWSRQSPIAVTTAYKPTEISFSYHFLYDLGFLELWKDLGEKYERGEI
ncbi:hypothetical protein [Litoribacillus peritrichatus]|uniref:Uncharacterized protein n=1 Tax=Litoribacillus peritrichatus TaxID=718191 RepID=A0ABP7NDD9_9GAMM